MIYRLKSFSIIILQWFFLNRSNRQHGTGGGTFCCPQPPSLSKVLGFLRVFALPNFRASTRECHGNPDIPTCQGKIQLSGHNLYT